MKPRYLRECVEVDLAEKMVFVGGPRQVGKTTFALSLLGEDQDESSPAYLSWDVLADREEILAAASLQPARWSNNCASVRRTLPGMNTR